MFRCILLEMFFMGFAFQRAKKSLLTIFTKKWQSSKMLLTKIHRRMLIELWSEGLKVFFTVKY